jgi:hypothetical protein
VFNDCNIQSQYRFLSPLSFYEEASLSFYIGALCRTDATPQYDNACCRLVLKRFAGLHQDIERDFQWKILLLLFCVGVCLNVAVGSNPLEFIPVLFSVLIIPTFLLSNIMSCFRGCV